MNEFAGIFKLSRMYSRFTPGIRHFLDDSSAKYIPCYLFSFDLSSQGHSIGMLFAISAFALQVLQYYPILYRQSYLSTYLCVLSLCYVPLVIVIFIQKPHK